MPRRAAPSASARTREPHAKRRGGAATERAPGEVKPVRRMEAEGAEPLPELEALMAGPVSGKVRIIFTDVDGTLTDGVITFDQTGDARNFFIRDGLCFDWARKNGVLPVAISGRDSKAVRLRMTDLGVEYYGAIADKVAVAQQVLEREGVSWGECVMIGDDLPDVPMLKRVGWPIAVGDAVREVKMIAKTVTGMAGGRGAVREVVEMVLRHNGTWDKVLEKYEAL